MSKNFTLITGAGRGLGKAFAHELASMGRNILLVSLSGEGLADFSAELSTAYKIKTDYLEIDLSKKKSVYKVTDWANRYEVDVLINNAGIGGTSRFDLIEPEIIDRMIQVNVYATAMLTRLLLPNLKRQTKSFILNVSSMAAFGPIAFKTVYPATKAFVLFFSRGLYEEFRYTNVFVSVLHPGPMRTNPEVVRRIDKLGIWGEIGLLSTQKIASIAVTGLFRRDSLIIPGFFNKLNWFLIQIVPIWIRLPVVSGIVRKEVK